MIQYSDVIIVPVIMALAELAKRTGLNAKYIPLLDIILGLIAGFVYLSADPKEAIFLGLMMGLTASGLYSGTKNTFEGVKAGK